MPLLRRRWTARAPRLPVFGPSPPRVLAPLVRHGIDLTPARPGQAVQLAGFTCTPFATVHGPPSCGWVLEDPDGRRVAIAGDTRPVPGVVEAVRGVDVLVYEATFAAHHAERAVQSGHSTATEAGMLAAEAGVGALVLTHMSARYPRSAVGAEAGARHPLVLVPNDLDQLLVEPVPAAARVGAGWADATLRPAGGTPLQDPRRGALRRPARGGRGGGRQPALRRHRPARAPARRLRARAGGDARRAGAGLRALRGRHRRGRGRRRGRRQAAGRVLRGARRLRSPR